MSARRLLSAVAMVSMLLLAPLLAMYAASQFRAFTYVRPTAGGAVNLGLAGGVLVFKRDELPPDVSMDARDAGFRVLPALNLDEPSRLVTHWSLVGVTYASGTVRKYSHRQSVRVPLMVPMFLLGVAPAAWWYGRRARGEIGDVVVRSARPEPEA